MVLLETFPELVRDPAHWQFELLVGFIEMVVFDVVVGAFVWPVIKRHIHRDINVSHGGDGKTFKTEMTWRSFDGIECYTCCYRAVGTAHADYCQSRECAQ